VKVTIVQNGDENAIVHKAGCADVRRHERHARAYLSDWDADVADRQAAANDAWSDFIAEESMTEADALGYTSFKPCCDDLPAETEPAS
jgi:hypothetical protein